MTDFVERCAKAMDYNAIITEMLTEKERKDIVIEILREAAEAVTEEMAEEGRHAPMYRWDDCNPHEQREDAIAIFKAMLAQGTKDD